METLHARWFRDRFLEFHRADQLWANAIRASEEGRLRSQDLLNDLVLDDLLRMGVFDWTGVEDRLRQGILPMWHASAMASRMIDRIIGVEQKVRFVDDYCLT